jgi:hypothetical protein
MCRSGENLLHKVDSIVQHPVSRLRCYRSCHLRGPTSWIRARLRDISHDMAEHAFRLTKSDTNFTNRYLRTNFCFVHLVIHSIFSHSFLDVCKNSAYPVKLFTVVRLSSCWGEKCVCKDVEADI